MKQRILLWEPSYKNKYPPLGLMKISRYHRSRGDHVAFRKGDFDRLPPGESWHRIYVTTLFSFEWKRTAEAIDAALALVPAERVFVGGISASLMTEQFKAVERWRGVRFVKGLLDKPPALSLSLRDGEDGFGDSEIIEELTPDYAILDQTSYDYPVKDAYFGYASRGCVRKCAFCGVPKLEGEQRVMPSISRMVNQIAREHGERKDLILMDNNVTAAPNFKEIIAEIRDLGFIPGASFARGGKSRRRRVDFNQGVDSRLMAKNPALLKGLASICIDPLRIAFDHWGVRKPYEASVREAAGLGVKSLSNYMLYNFHDSPEDLYRRMALNIELNIELGVRIWSFPMRYQPVDFKDRSFIGRRWNRHQLRSFQVMLQATRGVVSGKPDFFSFAYGDSEEAFMDLLALPHGFLFRRKHFVEGEGRAEFDDYMAALRKLSESERSEMLEMLSEASDSKQRGSRMIRFDSILGDRSVPDRIREAIRFHCNHGEALAWQRPLVQYDMFVPREKKVEDAGLYESA